MQFGNHKRPLAFPTWTLRINYREQKVKQLHTNTCTKKWNDLVFAPAHGDLSRSSSRKKKRHSFLVLHETTDCTKIFDKKKGKEEER